MTASGSHSSPALGSYLCRPGSGTIVAISTRCRGIVGTKSCASIAASIGIRRRVDARDGSNATADSCGAGIRPKETLIGWLGD
ncbi:hypothetical protein BBP40_011365 [Aspergillus hancockii]|nr:hypothetical protein BBP40_011365 [Aspergillus hancockii]